MPSCKRLSSRRERPCSSTTWSSSGHDRWRAEDDIVGVSEAAPKRRVQGYSCNSAPTAHDRRVVAVAVYSGNNRIQLVAMPSDEPFREQRTILRLHVRGQEKEIAHHG